jgi:hypothetical protein
MKCCECHLDAIVVVTNPHLQFAARHMGPGQVIPFKLDNKPPDVFGYCYWHEPFPEPELDARTFAFLVPQ